MCERLRGESNVAVEARLNEFHLEPEAKLMLFQGGCAPARGGGRCSDRTFRVRKLCFLESILHSYQRHGYFWDGRYVYFMPGLGLHRLSEQGESHVCPGRTFCPHRECGPQRAI